MNYKIKYEIDPNDFITIRKNVQWNEANFKQIEKALKNSMINISVFNEEECIAVGRIVGDKVYKSMLTDIMVKKEYQKKGVGTLIVKSLIEKINDFIGEGESFQLEASPTYKNRDFYIKCGLKYKPENQDGVYLWIRK